MEEIWAGYGSDMETEENKRTHHTTLSYHFTEPIMVYMVHCSFDHFPLREALFFVFSRF